MNTNNSEIAGYLKSFACAVLLVAMVFGAAFAQNQLLN